MDCMSIGSMIKEYRKRMGISQAALCEGLCELSTMNKIENGKQNPNKKLLEALIQRLQIPLALNIPSTETEFERGEIEKEIDNLISQQKYTIEVLLKKYKAVAPTMSKFENQYYLLCHAIYLRHEKKDIKTAFLELIEAIKLTFPQYTEDSNIQGHLFTSLEFSILNCIAICQHFMKQTDKSIALMKQLMICLEKGKLSSDIFIKKYPMVTYNLSMWLGTTKQYKKSLEISQKGIDYCLEHEQYSIVSDLFYNHGFTLLRLGEYDKGIEFIKKSLAFDSTMQRTLNLSLSIRDIETSFGKDFLLKFNTYSIL